MTRTLFKHDYRTAYTGREETLVRVKADHLVSQKTANYSDGPVDKEPCEACVMFVEKTGDKNRCTKVRGNIARRGHCKYWYAKPKIVQKDEIDGLDTLYVSRPLINADQLIAWAKANGFKTCLLPEDMHVTVCYSKQPMDWELVQPSAKFVSAVGGERSLERFGEGAVVLRFDSPALQGRHVELRALGASHDYPEYASHVTLTYDGAGIDLDSIQPFPGPLKFGPEIYRPTGGFSPEDAAEKADLVQKGGVGSGIKGHVTLKYHHTTDKYQVGFDPATGKEKWIEKGKYHTALENTSSGTVLHVSDKPLPDEVLAKAPAWGKQVPKGYAAPVSASSKPTTDSFGKVVTPAITPSGMGISAAVQTVDTSGWTKIGDQKGSNPGGLYKDTNGQEWYVKQPATLDHAKSEVLANRLYVLAGAKVPDVFLTTSGGVASKIVSGMKLGEVEKKYPADMKEAVPAAQKDFAADAWLANRDSVGLEKDNMIVVGYTNQFTVTRIDQGGSLKYRAQGGEKTDFGAKVTEFSTLRDPKMNAAAASVFGSMTNNDLVSSIDRVLAVSPDDVRKLVSLYGPDDKAAKETLTYTLLSREADLMNIKANLIAQGQENTKLSESLPETKGTGQPLTEAERYAISRYTGSGFMDMNEQLRQGVMTEETYKRIKDADTGLSKLPGVRGVSYRGTDLPITIADKYKPGMIVHELAFMSTSASKAGAFSGDTEFIVHGTSGRDVTLYSSHKGEKEILFPYGTMFKVTSVVKDGYGRKITLVEVPSA